MVDVHCHLNFHSFTDDFDAVIKDAHKAGVTTIINVGTKLDSSQQAVELAKNYENLYAIVGIHPHHADKLDDNWVEQLEQTAKQPKVVGIGECGLDYFRYKSNGIVDPILQRKIFIEQIELANHLKLPLQIHNRHAGEEVIKILKEHRSKLLPLPGMFHCFAGSQEVLKDALDLGFYIGFDGNITYKGLAPGESVLLPTLVKSTPLERIVTETDSPYLAPQPYRGSRNVPKYVILVGQFIAELKSVPFEEIKTKTTKNAYTLFKIHSQ